MYKYACAILLLITPSFGICLDAIPGAVGMGKNTLGGRYGSPTVYTVTNLSDSGAGSLRAACDATGPRFIVFNVSGNINLSTILTMDDPYVTIAGQTSPHGVAVSGKQFNVGTHDVIIMHMRFRSGGHEYTGDNSDGDSISLWGQTWGSFPVYNILIDHVSATWGTDESFSLTGGVTNTTLQSCMIAGGLWYAKSGYPSNHSKGLMVSGKDDDAGQSQPYLSTVSLYRNYIAHNYDRSPFIFNPNETVTEDMYVEGCNNVSFNWHSGLRPSSGGTANHVNWIANYAKEGPDSARFDAFMQIEAPPGTPYQYLYVLDNIGTARDPGDAQWLISEDWHSVIISTAWQYGSRWSMDYPLSYETMTASLAQEIVDDAGAHKPVRDSVDTAYVNSFATNTDLMESDAAGDKTYPDDWPTYSTNPDDDAWADTDADGMDDSWETSTYGNLSKAPTDSDPAGSGYMVIELWFHDLAGYEPIGDIIPPVISAASANGTTISITTDETTVWTGYDANDCNLDCTVTGNDINLTSPTGSGANWVLTAASSVQYGETCNLDCTLGTGDIEDASGNDMVTFADTSVVNNTLLITTDISRSVSGGGVTFGAE